MTKEEFVKMLESHDWFYSYSDDHRYWKKGMAESEAISRAVESNPEFKTVYRDFVKEKGLL